VHLKVQYSSSDGPGIMRWTTRRVSQSGQLERTVAEGNGVGLASDSHMDMRATLKSGWLAADSSAGIIAQRFRLAA
jgi:hypothetical protein